MVLITPRSRVRSPYGPRSLLRLTTQGVNRLNPGLVCNLGCLGKKKKKKISVVLLPLGTVLPALFRKSGCRVISDIRCETPWAFLDLTFPQSKPLAFLLGRGKRVVKGNPVGISGEDTCRAFFLPTFSLFLVPRPPVFLKPL